jgi:hypothetical protein
MRTTIGLAVVAVSSLLLAAGCDSIGPNRGPKYDIDWGKVDTGEPALTPKNNDGYMNGMPQNARTK